MVMHRWRQALTAAITQAAAGQGLVEYGLIMMLVALVVIAAVSALGGSLSNMYNTVVNVFR